MFWHYYEGDMQRYYLDRFSGETPNEYADRVEQALVVNECRKCINRIAQYLYGSDTPVSRRCEDDEANDFLQRVWRYNNMHSSMLDVSVNTSITGFTVIQNVLRDIRTDKPFPLGASPLEIRQYGVIKFNPLPSMHVIPKGMNGRMNELIIMEVEEGRVELKGALSPMVEKIRSVMYVSDDYWIYWILDDRGNGARVIPPGYEGDELVAQGLNPYSDVNMPFAIYRNHLGNMNEIIGDSDLMDMIEPQKGLNEITTDDRNVIRNHGNPILALFGASLPDDFRRKSNTVLEFDSADMDARYITWDYDMEASGRLFDKLEQKIYESLGLSEISFGNLRNIGQVRNLKSAYLGDIKTTLHKRGVFELAEIRHAKNILRLWEYITGIKFSSYKMELTWPDDFVPIDEFMAAQTEQIRIVSGQVSLRDIVKERYPGLSTDEAIDAKVAEILYYIDRIGHVAEPGMQTAKGPSGSSEEKELEQRTQ